MVPEHIKSDSWVQILEYALALPGVTTQQANKV